MGSQNSSQLQTHQVIDEELHQLHFSHQSNIYVKFQYLVKHYDQYQIQQLLLDHNMIRTELMVLLANIDLKSAKRKLRVICLSKQTQLSQVTTNQPAKVSNLSSTLNLFISLLYIQVFQVLNKIDHNSISNDGCYYLTKPKLQSLQTLDLTSNQISEEGCRYLATGIWPQLKTLLISQNKLNVKGLLYLSKGQWPNLMFVQAKNNAFQVDKRLEETTFRTQVKFFALELR